MQLPSTRYFTSLLPLNYTSKLLQEASLLHLVENIEKRWGRGFNRREPSDNKIIHLHPPVLDIFRIHQWLAFFELLKGYDDDIAYEFSMALKSHT